MVDFGNIFEKMIFKVHGSLSVFERGEPVKIQGFGSPGYFKGTGGLYYKEFCHDQLEFMGCVGSEGLLVQKG